MASAWSAARQQGFALAASAHDDRGAERALAGLVPDVAEQATARARELAGQDRAARRRWLRDALGSGRPALGPQPADRPARALGLLAGEVTRELGRSWLAASPPPRPGFVPAPRLLALLRALCARTGEP